MSTRFRLIRRGIRGNRFYCVDTSTGKRTSLRTADENAAMQEVEAKNIAERQPMINRQIAKAYLAGGDSGINSRTWQNAMDSIIGTKKDANRKRWQNAAKDHALEPLLPQVIVDTQAETLLNVLQRGTVSTNVFLRRLHNFCVDLNWLPWPLIPKRKWPAIRFKDKRAITWEEHCRIAEREQNPERKAFYRLAWHLGASQSDLANLHAEDVDWSNCVISFFRMKTHWRGQQPPQISFGAEVHEILISLPKSGPLFPYLRSLREADRATEFRRCCRRANISGPSTFSPADIKGFESLAIKLFEKLDPVSEFLRDQLSDVIAAPAQQYLSTKTIGPEFRESLATALNKIISRENLHEVRAFREVKRRHETIELQSKRPKGIQLGRLNRMILEDAYPLELSKNDSPEVTLHSYRYSWAERAKRCGYPERFAQMALGHNSKAVHRAYAKKAEVTLPPLEEYERLQLERKVIPLRGKKQAPPAHERQSKRNLATA